MCENGHLGLHIVLTKCIFYTKEVSFTIVFYYNLYKTGSFAQNFKKKTEKIQDNAILAVSSPLLLRMRPIPKCVFGT